MRINVVETGDVGDLRNDGNEMAKKAIDISQLHTMLNNLPKDSMLHITFDAEDPE